jgi:hypothetical protein
MKSQFERFIRVRLYKIVIGALLVATVICTVIYFTTNWLKIEPIMAGMVTGLIVALVKYLLDWNEHQEIETIKKLGIQRILPHRDDKIYYQRLLAGAEHDIVVLGNTALRFLDDFAHSTRTDSRALFEALGRGVQVRVLVPTPEYLPIEDRPRAEMANRRMAQIARESSNFQYRHFNHLPTHSLVKVDNECLFGPVFSFVKSKDSPTIHADADSALVVAYLQYFENEWTQASTT